MGLNSSKTLAVASVAVLLVSGVGFASSNGGYEVSVALDSATNVVRGGPVLVNGFEAGHVESIEIENGKAVVALSLSDEFAPLHDGAEVTVGWKAVLSERQVEVIDGPDENASIPDGGVIAGTMPKPTEITDVLQALDAPTRAKVATLVARLDQTFSGSESEIAATLQSAGPALRELGELMQAMGTDGPAIRNLVTRMNDMMSVVAGRDDEVQQVVDHLTTLTDRVAQQRSSVAAALKLLPGTLKQARATLDQVPGAVAQAAPLLNDLGPATAALKPVARDLRPLLRDLRPLTADLDPALAALAQLLHITPGLLDDSHGLLPSLTQTLKRLHKPVEFMRPYTPEFTGYFSEWASAFANYDSNGNFARILANGGTTSFNENPGVVPPGLTYDPYPAPGAVVGQPWTDANGSELR